MAPGTPHPTERAQSKEDQSTMESLPQVQEQGLPSTCYPPHHSLPFRRHGSQIPSSIHISIFHRVLSQLCCPLPASRPTRATAIPLAPGLVQGSKRAPAHPCDPGWVKSSGTSWTAKLHFHVTVNVCAQIERILL